MSNILYKFCRSGDYWSFKNECYSSRINYTHVYCCLESNHFSMANRILEDFPMSRDYDFSSYLHLCRSLCEYTNDRLKRYNNLSKMKRDYIYDMVLSCVESNNSTGLVEKIKYEDLIEPLMLCRENWKNLIGFKEGIKSVLRECEINKVLDE